MRDEPSRGATRPLEFRWRAPLSACTAAAALFRVQRGAGYVQLRRVTEQLFYRAYV